MKRIFIKIVVMILAIGLSGCSGGGTPSGNDPSIKSYILGDYLVTGDLFFYDDNNGWVTVQTADNIANFTSQLLHTTDGGVTWNTINADLGELNLGAIKFTSPTDGYAIIGTLAQEMLCYTTDAGATWTKAFDDNDNVDIADDIVVYAFASNSDYTVALVFSQQVAARATEIRYISNTTHQVVDSKTFEIPYSSELNVNIHIDEDGNIALGTVKRKTAGVNNTYYELPYYDDNSQAWSYTKIDEKIPGYIVSSRTMDFVSAKVGYYLSGYDNQYRSLLYKTIDGGKTWTKVFDLNTNIEMEKIGYIDFADETHGIASSGLAFSGGWKTTDGGVTWTEIEEFDINHEFVNPTSISYPSIKTSYFSAIKDGSAKVYKISE